LLLRVFTDRDASPCQSYERQEWDGQLPDSVSALINSEPRVRQLLENSACELGYPSGSEADMALASKLALRGIPECQIDFALRFRRAHVDVKHKHDGYFRQTVEKAKASADKSGISFQSLRTDEPPPIGGEHRTDLGNARRLVRLHGGDLRYCHALCCWFVWDGCRWCRDETDEVTRRAKSTVQTIYSEATKAGDEEQRKALAKWAMRSEGKVFIQHMIALATSEPGILVLTDDLDADPWSLNVLNGTINLRTGALRPHRREDLITKLAPVEYDPDARSDVFDRFLQHALPDPDTRRYTQKAAGLMLLGQAGADKTFIVYGPTRTGKGTFQDALAAALGDYAMTAGLGDFEQRDRARGPQPEIVRLRGARAVFVYETSRRLKLSASLLKSVAGSDPITVRDLYAKPITFLPQFTLLIATNHRPKIPDDDDALWERIVELPFRAQIPSEERDPAVRAELRDPKASGAAVLAWAVNGCLAYQAEGLTAPQIVEHATQEYREEMNPIGEFINECCVLGEGLWASSAELRREYQFWCKENGITPLRSEFAKRLRARGCIPDRTSKVRGWRGIGCNPTDR